MPTKKALEKAYINGYVASGHNRAINQCPYQKNKGGGTAYRKAWINGYLGFLTDHGAQTQVFIECDECRKETMHPDIFNNKDVFICDACGFCVDNLELMELKDESTEY